MHLSAEQLQIASLIDKQVQELAGTGMEDILIFAEMADYMPGFKRVMDTSTRSEMDALCEQYSGFCRYAKILERIAAGIQSSEIKVPR